MQLPPIDFIVLDTETTGFVPKVHHVIEFASVRVSGGTVAEEYEQLFSIGHPLPPIITALTRIKDADLKEQPTIVEKRDEILRRIGTDTLIVGQNVSFDIGILKGENIDLSDRPWIDTSMLASLVFPELESYSLAYVSSVLNLNHEPVHRALGDVHATLELLGRCWARLLELPQKERDQAVDIMRRSSPGYRMLFAALPTATATTRPAWLQSVSPGRNGAQGASHSLPALRIPEPGMVELAEEPPAPHVLQTIIDAAAKDTGSVHWIAVKNMEAAVRRLRIGKEVRVLYPPFLLADDRNVDALAAQETMTADEATLLLKLVWYGARTQGNLPIHGDEHAIWNGKLACTETSESYVRQFRDLPSVVLLDHRQLLQFLADPQYTGRDALSPHAHIIIDDASMLEDTATRAYGWFCDFDELRAAAEGNDALTKLLDLAQIWIERTRNSQDIRYLAVSDITSADAHGLRTQVEACIASGGLSEHAERQLTHMLQMLDQTNLKDRITYIEHRIDGSQSIRSVPERVGTFLRDHLYGVYATTLLIPPGSNAHLHEILPGGTATRLNTSLTHSIPIPFTVGFPDDLTLETLLHDPPEGKTILLSPSKRTIDETFVRYAETLEAKGITLICQGLSGGINRSSATFIAAESPAFLIMTPWAYEGLDLPPGLVRTLCMLALPFDHPSHAVLSKRSEHYKDPFSEYSLPRMKQRLFRLLRTFSNHATRDGEVLVLDQRIATKGYGREVKSYLESISATEEEQDDQMAML